MKKNTKRFALSALLAAVTGYLAGILTAPKSGKETREEIKDVTTKSINEAEKELKKLHTELNQVITQAKTRADELSGKAKADLDGAITMAKQGKEKVREILSAVHEGDAADKDLQTALKDAQKALDHLKTFLTK